MQTFRSLLAPIAAVALLTACGSSESNTLKQNTAGAGGATGSGGATSTSSTTGSGGASTGTTGSGGASTGTTTGSGGAGSGCTIFPADNAWNTDISNAPVDARSADYVASIGAGSSFHPDFGTVYGIPFVDVDDSVQKVAVAFDYADESDPGPYPIPPNPPIEDGGDHHILMVHTGECVLYELFDASQEAGGWHAGSGAIWDLKKNSTRPAGWTSADAAGLPIYPGLTRYDEVESGEIRHALRFTAPDTQKAYVAPASHFASNSTDPTLPPMGVRMRLKASVDVSGYSGSAKVIVTALKKYGMILADNGSSWFMSGAPDSRWNDDELNTLKQLHGSDFEAIETGPLTTN